VGCLVRGSAPVLATGLESWAKRWVEDSGGLNEVDFFQEETSKDV